MSLLALARSRSEESELNPFGSEKAHVAITPWSHHWPRDDGCAGCGKRICSRPAICCLKRDPHLFGNSPPNLNLIDRTGLCLVEDFQRGMTSVQEHSMAAIVLPGGQLLQTERVSKHCYGAIKVVDRQYES